MKATVNLKYFSRDPNRTELNTKKFDRTVLEILHFFNVFLGFGSIELHSHLMHLNGLYEFGSIEINPKNIKNMQCIQKNIIFLALLNCSF
jgi:hypothetical protein